LTTIVQKNLQLDDIAVDLLDYPFFRQCPIEDFFGQLSSILYKDEWAAKNVEELKKRIKSSIKKIDFTTVQNNFLAISNLRKCTDNGPYNKAH
jgi:hypothetical protein